MTRDSGFALVMTLLITALLVAVAVEFIHEVYVETSLGRSYTNVQQASLMADSGVQYGMAMLQDSLAGRHYSSLRDRWATPIDMANETGRIRVEIIDETGKLNLNAMVFPNGMVNPDSFAAVRRLIASLNLSADLCDSVVDWIDPDDEPHPGGGESTYYRSLPTPYQAKNAPLDTVDELRLLRGFDEQTTRALTPFVTVCRENYGGASGRVNVNTAPREVLASLDEAMTGELADRIVARRIAEPFGSPGEIARVSGLETVGIGLQGKITVMGNLYRIYSRATVKGTNRGVEALVRMEGASLKVVYWREL